MLGHNAVGLVWKGGFMDRQRNIGMRGTETRQRLVEAMLELVNEGGMPVAASVRSIARRAGVTEAVLYRYFPNKDAMFREVWSAVLAPMVQAKLALIESDEGPPEALLESWIRVTYQHFDADPAAFHYVYLSEGTAAWREDPAYRVQGDMLADWFAGVRPEAIQVGMTHARLKDYFVATLLSVPREIRLGALPGPACDHVEETLAVSRGIFGI